MFNVRCSVLTEHRTPVILDVMVNRRTSSGGGVDALRDAAVSIGLRVRTDQSPRRSSPDLVLINPSGGQLQVQVTRKSLVSARGLATQLRDWRGVASATGSDVVVADRITSDAKDVLRQEGWGWLDLRGHLHLAGPGFFVDTAVPGIPSIASSSDPLAGKVGMEVACLLLLTPDRKSAIRRMATELGRAPSSVSDVVSRLRAAGMIDDQNLPVVAELFPAVSAHWQSTHVDVSSLPTPGKGAVNKALRLGIDPSASERGWALTDTTAAAAYGAAISVRSNYPLDFYVPDEVTLRRAVQLLGPAADHAHRAATIRLAPVSLVCDRRIDATKITSPLTRVAHWPLAQPLFVALDLAQDPGRGHEILDAWTPPEPWHRVW